MLTTDLLSSRSLRVEFHKFRFPLASTDEESSTNQTSSRLVCLLLLQLREEGYAWYSASTLGWFLIILSFINKQLVTKSDHIICAVNYKLENIQGIHILLAFADICQLCWLITPQFGSQPSTISSSNIFDINGFQATIIWVEYFCLIPILK